MPRLSGACFAEKLSRKEQRSFQDALGLTSKNMREVVTIYIANAALANGCKLNIQYSIIRPCLSRMVQGYAFQILLIIISLLLTTNSMKVNPKYRLLLRLTKFCVSFSNKSILEAPIMSLKGPRTLKEMLHTKVLVCEANMAAYIIETLQRAWIN